MSRFAALLNGVIAGYNFHSAITAANDGQAWTSLIVAACATFSAALANHIMRKEGL